MALSLLVKMQAQWVHADIVSYNAAISACLVGRIRACKKDSVPS